jgi:MFS-type transporter involved in bile tolerance (Atg22 family)
VLRRIAFDWANSPTSNSVLSGFLPLLVQEVALQLVGASRGGGGGDVSRGTSLCPAAPRQAGFPDVCGNLVTAPAALATVYGNTTSQTGMR